MAKRKSRGDWKDYPDTNDFRTGIKVGSRCYASKEEAVKCSEAAMHNAKIQAAAGYDFGFCSPGSITKLED